MARVDRHRVYTAHRARDGDGFFSWRRASSRGALGDLRGGPREVFVRNGCLRRYARERDDHRQRTQRCQGRQRAPAGTHHPSQRTDTRMGSRGGEQRDSPASAVPLFGPPDHLPLSLISLISRAIGRGPVRVLDLSLRLQDDPAPAMAARQAEESACPLRKPVGAANQKQPLTAPGTVTAHHPKHFERMFRRPDPAMRPDPSRNAIEGPGFHPGISTTALHAVHRARRARIEALTTTTPAIPKQWCARPPGPAHHHILRYTAALRHY